MRYNAIQYHPLVYHPLESSPLHTRREPNSPGYLWKKTAQGIHQANRVSGAMRQITAKVASIPVLKMPISPLHPFKIYHCPEQFRFFRTTPIAREDEWRTVRVRAGLVITQDVPGVFVNEGTDGIDRPYDEVYVTLADETRPTQNDITCDLADITYFWLELGQDEELGLTAVFHHHVDPTADGWTSFPEMDGSQVILGWVDTNYNPALIRQIQTTDVISNGAVCPL